MKVSDFSALARVVDPRYPTNLAIILIAMISGAAVFALSLFQGETIVSGITNAILLGITVFLTWAIGREIDPEHELAAFIGILFVIPGFWILGAPDLILVLTLLLLLRMLNRSTGLPTKLLDSLSITTLGAFQVFLGEWVVGLLCAFALFMDSRLSEPLKRNLYFSGFMIVISITSLLMIYPDLALPELTTWQFVVVIGSFLLFLPLIIQSKNIDVICDLQTKRLNPRRVQAAQLFAIFFGALFWLSTGLAGIINLLPLWSSVIGVSLAYYFANLSRKLNIPSTNF